MQRHSDKGIYKLTQQENSFACVMCGNIYSEESGATKGFTCEDCASCEHDFICNGTIDSERDFYGLKLLVEYECQDCHKIEQNWERESN